VRRLAASLDHAKKLITDSFAGTGSFRVLQRYALRASTAAPTVFKPILMGGEMYCDGGIVASNPAAVAIHEARTLFPDIPIELVVSVGTGGEYISLLQR
jgi:predicted acylesterase/phospholipase RssA